MPEDQKIQFRGDNRAYRTSSLFHERWILFDPERRGNLFPVFSLHQDLPNLINARRTFVELADPTGYKWAMKYLDGWQHWLRLIDAPWFQEALGLWNSEIKAKMTADALKKVSEIAQGTSPAAFQAAKYLASKEYEKGSKTRGRPSKAEINGELQNAIKQIQSDEEDFQRAKGLTLVASN